MNFTGYIEGYYGRLLSWQDRLRILGILERNNLNSFFYCPKEDQFHRTMWKEPYPEDWLKEFKSFALEAQLKEIEIIFGISPGIGFNRETDINILFDKIDLITSLEIKHVAILFDDLFEDLSGQTHAEILNECIIRHPNVNFFAVPKEYSSSQAKPDITSSNYLTQFNKILNPEVPIFWTGSQVVSQYSSQEEVEAWKNTFKRPVIFWDNYFANDYCGPKVILESYQSMSLVSARLLNGLMINPTGLLEVDEVCLDFLGYFLDGQKISAKEYFKSKNFPSEFIDVLNFFKFKPTLKNSEQDSSNIEKLLWTWHHPLKLELYPYLHMIRFMLKVQNQESISVLKKRFRI
tara:strand:+ start:205 stop:1248 length:1044 start_codon:yes stop_codon:yes gene_type:complete